MTAGSKAKFCEGFHFQFDGLVWMDLTGMAPLGNDRVIRLDLSTQNRAESYVGFQVSIINKVSGTIDQKFFNFNDYLDIRKNRLDDRGPGRPHEYVETFYVWKKDGELQWYIAHPVSKKPYVDAIRAYVDLFR